MMNKKTLIILGCLAALVLWSYRRSETAADLVAGVNTGTLWADKLGSVDGGAIVERF